MSLVANYHPVRDFQTMLTRRETEILLDVAEGLSAKESAVRRDISEFTIVAHRRTIITKLGARNITSAVAVALRQGIIE